MDTAQIVVAVMWFFAAMVGGICGLGPAMMAVPVISFFVPIKTDILITCIIAPFASILLVLMHLRFCRWRSLIPLFLGIVPGVAAGLYVLCFVPAWTLEIIVGVMLLFFMAWQQFGSLKSGRESWGLGAFAGGAAGFFGTSISVDGPPVAAYALYVGWRQRPLLATLGVFYFCRSLVTCGMQWYAGLYTPEVLHYAICGVPASILGTLASYRLVRRMKPEAFQLLLKIIIVFGALSCLIRGLMTLWG